MDIIDRAQRTEHLNLSDAIARARGSVASGESRADCMHCGDPIPEARQLAVPGCQLCIDCQQELEHERT